MAEAGPSGDDDVEYEPINVTVKDDDGKARIQTNPIKGLTKSAQPVVDILPDGIEITADVRDPSDPSKTTTYRSRIRLQQDVSKDCKINRKEVTSDGRLIIHIKKNSDFKLARLVRIRKPQFTVEESS